MSQSYGEGRRKVGDIVTILSREDNEVEYGLVVKVYEDRGFYCVLLGYNPNFKRRKSWLRYGKVQGIYIRPSDQKSNLLYWYVGRADRLTSLESRFNRKNKDEVKFLSISKSTFDFLNTSYVYVLVGYEGTLYEYGCRFVDSLKTYDDIERFVEESFIKLDKNVATIQREQCRGEDSRKVSSDVIETVVSEMYAKIGHLERGLSECHRLLELLGNR